MRYRIKVHGSENLPRHAAVIACNHLAYTDFRFHLKALSGKLKFLGYRNSTNFMIINKLISLLFNATFGLVDRILKRYAIFLEKNRPIDRKTVIHVLNALKSGNSLIIMPQGVVSRDKPMNNFSRGACYFAIKAHCQLVPVALYIKKEGLFFRKIIYHIGKPLILEQKNMSEREMSFFYTGVLQKAVNKLLKQV